MLGNVFGLADRIQSTAAQLSIESLVEDDGPVCNKENKDATNLKREQRVNAYYQSTVSSLAAAWPWPTEYLNWMPSPKYIHLTNSHPNDKMTVSFV